MSGRFLWIPTLAASAAGAFAVALVSAVLDGSPSWALAVAFFVGFAAATLVGQVTAEWVRRAPGGVQARVFRRGTGDAPREGGGPFDRFDDRAKRALVLAQDEAIRFNHRYIDTEHLLLGLIREGEGVAARVLGSLGVELSKVRDAVETVVGRGDSTASPSEIKLSPRTKKVVECAVDESRKLGHTEVGTEHLLMGLIREREGIAAGVLDSLGVSLETIRHEVIAMLGVQHATEPAAPPIVPLERFDDGARRALAFAKDEAARLNHNYIGTEHILLALLREETGLAAQVLRVEAIDIRQVRSAVELIIGRGDAPVPPTEIAISPRAKRVLDLAWEEAVRLGNARVATHHLLLGLAREGQGIASGILESLGLSMDRLDAAVRRGLGEEGGSS